MEVCAHPAVKEAAAVAVPSEHGEDEVLVAISLAPGAELDPADLIGFLIPRMAHFMVPRYVRIVDLLPRTPTQKVEKHLIRSEGSCPAPSIARRPASASSASASVAGRPDQTVVRSASTRGLKIEIGAATPRTWCSPR